MYLQASLAAAVLLAGQTLGAPGPILLFKGLAGSPELVARAAVRPTSQLTVRVEGISTTGVRKRDESTARLQKMDTGTWDGDTAAACTTALAALTGHTSNPSGMAVCYNLPFYDNTTGVFQADLRLFHVSDPRDEWAGLQSRDVDVGLSYIGAAISTRAMKRTAPLKFTLSRLSAKGYLSGRLEERQDVPTLRMLQAFNFVGQINRDLMTPNLTEAEAQTLLIPNIVLSATNPRDQKINTTLPSDEVHFVNGVFANANKASSPTTSPAAAPAGAAAPSTAFVLPGTTLGIFPVGLIITSAWTALFIAAVGYGTIQRYQFRKHYRMRMRRGVNEPKTL